VRHLAYVGANDTALPVALFASAWAGIPFVPLSYRLAPTQLRDLLHRHDDLLVLTDHPLDLDAPVMTLADWSSAVSSAPTSSPTSTTMPDDVAALLYTSGTTAAPKAVVLRHRHLASYVIGSVELGSAGEEDATLVSVPPYHVAGLAGIASNVYAGRRLVYLPSFDADRWLRTVAVEGVTHAMVVPTMLARIVDRLEEVSPQAKATATATLRTLAYGGARVPEGVLDRALAALPDTGFVNAYGLTETSSTVAILGPEDHRSPARRGSVGRVVPGVQVEVRSGEIWVRGEQVSGEYLGDNPTTDAAGWFPTHDRGRLDADGYLWVEGRADDTIIRGGENIAPAEIEAALLAHPAVREVAVVGLPDDEWGQRIAAVVVTARGAALDPDDLRAWARPVLRSAKTPDVVVFRSVLPYTETGKLLRRLVLADLQAELGAAGAEGAAGGAGAGGAAVNPTTEAAGRP
jgi:acyl-CoA synthetase (AMP-forming)/AMP-acid ligase II